MLKSAWFIIFLGWFPIFPLYFWWLSMLSMVKSFKSTFFLVDSHYFHGFFRQFAPKIRHFFPCAPRGPATSRLSRTSERGCAKNPCQNVEKYGICLQNIGFVWICKISVLQIKNPWSNLKYTYGICFIKEPPGEKTIPSYMRLRVYDHVMGILDNWVYKSLLMELWPFPIWENNPCLDYGTYSKCTDWGCKTHMRGYIYIHTLYIYIYIYMHMRRAYTHKHTLDKKGSLKRSVRNWVL